MRRILAVLLLTLTYSTFGQVATVSKSPCHLATQIVTVENKNADCVTMKFRYLELDNFGWTTTELKHVEIFLDEKAFSEDNLKTLFSYLSQKYSATKRLIVIVHTNWEQLDFPSDCPPMGLTNQPPKKGQYDYHQATYYRDEKVEYFQYNPTLRTPDFKLVILKGKKINANSTGV